MKYGPVLTYKDIEEAKKLIGKKVVRGSILNYITEDPETCQVAILDAVSQDSDFLFSDIFGNLTHFQFIREVIDEPQYRPFTPEELTEQVGKVFRCKDTGIIAVATVFIDGTLNMARDGHPYTGEEFLEHYEFVDGRPCGVEE